MAALPGNDLFDDEEDEAQEDSASLKIRVNKRYAKEYQSRKQREELLNARQQGEDSSSSSSSESEDEDGDLLSPSVDINILKTIHALRNKDERIYDASTRFFPETDSSNDGSDNNKQEKKHTPKKFKDVLREQIVEQMEQEDDDDMNGDDTGDEDQNDAKRRGHDDTNDSKNHLLYNQEQKELRSAFLQSTNDQNDESTSNDDNDWMVLKKRAKRETDNETEQLIQQELEALEKTTTSGENTLKDPRGEVEDGDKFLLDFIKNKKWIDKDNDESSSEEEGDDNRKQGDNDSDADSMDELDRADDFESKYNFRFEQAEAEVGTSGADFSVMGYARSGTMDTLRRKDETRKQKRQERKERKAAERKAKEEQLRRLKNAKREEMESKLKQIKSVLGDVEGRGMAVDEATMMKLMEGDYDPDQFEEIMNDAYGDDFYQQQDAEWKTDHDVRESLLKEEDGNMIAGLDDEAGGLYDNEDGDADEEYGDEEGEGTAQNEEWIEGDYDEQEEQGVAYAHDPHEGETETERKLREKMKDELYKLDYEDIIAGMPTRFKYRSVPKNDYGLSTEEILFAKDATLKSFVSLKKMAPYREDGEYHVGSKKRRRFRDMLKQDIEEAMEEMGEQQPQVNEDEQGEAEAPKKKRRRQKKGKKKGKQDSDTNQPTAGEGEDLKEAPHEDDTKSKRKRKKKGKKATKQEEVTNAVADVVPAKVIDDSPAEPKEITMIDADGTSKKAKKKKHNKKKKKTKTVAVEGVSASRLASYNL